MDNHRHHNDIQMDYAINVSGDYGIGNMSPKHRKILPCQDERHDSGLDSYKSEDFESLQDHLDSLHLSDRPCTSPYESWKLHTTDDGDTLLHLAIIHEAETYALQIIKQSHRDPFLDVQNNQRQTPLHLAVIMDQHTVVEYLLKAGCDSRLVDQSGNTALHIACKKGSMTSFSLLTQTTQSSHLHSIINFANYNGLNCLHLASIHGFLSMVEVLVQLGADINAKEQCSGRTALHLAVDLQNLPLVRQLISLGANVNSLTYGGFAPYHLTFGRHNSEIQQQLYVKTADELRDLPCSECDSDEESWSEEMAPSESEVYDDILFGGIATPVH